MRILFRNMETANETAKRFESSCHWRAGWRQIGAELRGWQIAHQAQSRRFSPQY
jgi:hypothetical protein